jgi:uncharacterized protein YuzE
MSNPNIKYDEISDTLTISFESGVEATGIELTEHILLRINKSQRKAISINIFEYSVLSQKTEMGTRSFPITGLTQLSREMQEIVFDILLNEPVSKYLHLSAYTLSIVETIPIVSVQSIPVGIEG